VTGTPDPTPAPGPVSAPGPAAPVDQGPVPRLTPVQAALIAETCSRGEVVWLRPPGSARAVAAWHVWHDDALCVLSGAGEQTLPELAGPVEVVARGKATLARLVTFEAHAYRLPPGSAAWLEATAELAAHRLNEPDPAGARARWASAGTVTMLRPVALTASGNGTDDDPADAAPPARGPATTLGRMPFHLGRRRGRKTR
jgi:hypothetical protein